MFPVAESLETQVLTITGYECQAEAVYSPNTSEPLATIMTIQVTNMAVCCISTTVRIAAKAIISTVTSTDT